MSEPVQKFVVETLLFLAGLLITVGLPWLVLRRLRSGKPSATPQLILDDGAGGKVIPLLASFSGLRCLPWIGLASNNLNPRLVITPDGIFYRVLGLRTCSWVDIAQVDVRTLGATVNIGFVFRDSPITFDANVGSIILAAQTLALLPTDVVLTRRARSVLTVEI
ncbi:hypothetical protein GCM10022268_31240 [Sphingomonas cynarae]|uniref:Uncharacterized protein n=1 Tax=Sphingomonas cynarae TaxID=930197 RepID=A0ABP7EKR5_9SPHN